ncbi:MAG: hypothetical protein WCO26_16795, partial [Deltaproteobacteria bacterium]
MSEIGFVDTTLRDGQASLWAEHMRTDMMLSVTSQMENAGFYAIELIAGSHFKKCVRELHEDPWERIRLVAQQIKKTPLRAVGAYKIDVFALTPDSVGKLWLERLAANGIRQIRISDPANDPAEWRKSVHYARLAGLEPILNLIFSVAPKYTDDYYATKAHEAAMLEVPGICLKDPGGLLTPERTRTLTKVISENAKGITLEIHSHCTTGLAPICYLEAVKMGVKIVDTAIPPLSNASSLPSVFNVVNNLKAMGYKTIISDEALRPVSEQLTSIAKREGLPLGSPVEYDYYQYLHQIPGGMISNLRHQLSKVRMEHRLKDVLEEAIRVRAEMGYPIMVTPFSQFVGTQAAINIMQGKRYEKVSDQVIQYALGFWSEEAASSMDPDIKDKILSRPQAQKLSKWKPPETTIQEIRSQL